jgi:hypothetical protein
VAHKNGRPVEHVHEDHVRDLEAQLEAAEKHLLKHREKLRDNPSDELRLDKIARIEAQIERLEEELAEAGGN